MTVCSQCNAHNGSLWCSKCFLCALIMTTSDLIWVCVPSQWLCVTSPLLGVTFTMTLCDPHNDYCGSTMTLCDLHEVSLWPFKWFVCLHNDSVWPSQWFLCPHNDSVCPQILNMPSKWLFAYLCLSKNCCTQYDFVHAYNMLWVFTVTLCDMILRSLHNESVLSQ